MSILLYLSLKPSSTSEVSALAMTPGEHRYEFLSRDLAPVIAVAPGQDESGASPLTPPPLAWGSSCSSSVPGCSIIHMASTVMFWASTSPRAPGIKTYNRSTICRGNLVMPRHRHVMTHRSFVTQDELVGSILRTFKILGRKNKSTSWLFLEYNLFTLTSCICKWTTMGRLLQIDWPVASRALVIWRREKPISNRGTAIAGGGGDVDSLLLGSDRAEGNNNDIIIIGVRRLNTVSKDEKSKTELY